MDVCLAKWADPVSLSEIRSCQHILTLDRNSQEPSGRQILPQGMYLLLVTNSLLQEQALVQEESSWNLNSS